MRALIQIVNGGAVELVPIERVIELRCFAKYIFLFSKLSKNLVSVQRCMIFAVFCDKDVGNLWKINRKPALQTNPIKTTTKTMLFMYAYSNLTIFLHSGM